MASWPLCTCSGESRQKCDRCASLVHPPLANLGEINFSKLRRDLAGRLSKGPTRGVQTWVTYTFLERHSHMYFFFHQAGIFQKWISLEPMIRDKLKKCSLLFFFLNQIQRWQWWREGTKITFGKCLVSVKALCVCSHFLPKVKSALIEITHLKRGSTTQSTLYLLFVRFSLFPLHHPVFRSCYQVIVKPKKAI